MGVLSNVWILWRRPSRRGSRSSSSGARLPMRLPEMVADNSVNLVPIISSGPGRRPRPRAWAKRLSRTADAFVLEGPLAGGHSGFSAKELTDLEGHSRWTVLLPQVLASGQALSRKVRPQDPSHRRWRRLTGTDIARMLQAGASGVQMATRFVCTRSARLAQVQADLPGCQGKGHRDHQEPRRAAGPGRPKYFLQDLEADRLEKISCPYHCLATCEVAHARTASPKPCRTPTRATWSRPGLLRAERPPDPCDRLGQGPDGRAQSRYRGLSRSHLKALFPRCATGAPAD